MVISRELKLGFCCGEQCYICSVFIVQENLEHLNKLTMTSLQISRAESETAFVSR